MPELQTSAEYGPLILGSTGRIGSAFRHVLEAGHWPREARPLWHGRRAGPGIDYAWDMSAPPPVDPRLASVRGMIVLAGGRGDRGTPTPETAAALAKAALDLAAREGIGPVLVASSQAVYAPSPGPHSEDEPTQGTSDYARAKQAVESAIAGQATALRIGNVAGSDMLLKNAATSKVTLDRFSDGRSPRRCYIGPKTLARVMLDLIDAPGPLPSALNIAAPGSLEMADLLGAAGLHWLWRDAPESALAELGLDLSRLASVVHLDPKDGTADALIAEARIGGWSPTR